MISQLKRCPVYVTLIYSNTESSCENKDMYIVQACTYLLSHDDLAVQKMSRCIWCVLYDNYSHDQNLHCVWLTIFGANTNMHNCVYLYIWVFVYLFRCVHCVWPIIPGTNVCLASSPHSCRLCSLYRGSLQVFLNDGVDDCPSPRPTLPSQDPRNPVTFLSLDFIFVSIWISLLSI